MSIERCTLSNNLKAKELYYSDDFFSLKGEKITPSDSFTFNSYEALKDVNDFKTNNYSNLFLTKKQKLILKPCRDVYHIGYNGFVLSVVNMQLHIRESILVIMR